MFRKRTAALLIVLGLTLMLSCAYALSDALGDAHATTIGIGDRADAPTHAGQQLGATTYRIVIDPANGLASYDQRIGAHRAAGQEPQLVIGGTGTRDHDKTTGIVDTAVAAAKRWPYAYSIGVINEPNESGMGVCDYARTYLAAHTALKAEGVRRIPFGEWSPQNAEGWHSATLTRCGETSLTLKKLVKRISWHAYWKAIEFGPIFRRIHKRVGAVTPILHITEAGGVLRARSVQAAGPVEADLIGLRYWRHALRIVKRDRIAQIVVHGLHDEGGNWSSGLVDHDGRVRPAFHLIASHISK